MRERSSLHISIIHYYGWSGHLLILVLIVLPLSGNVRKRFCSLALTSKNTSSLLIHLPTSCYTYTFKPSRSVSQTQGPSDFVSSFLLRSFCFLLLLSVFCFPYIFSNYLFSPWILLLASYSPRVANLFLMKSKRQSCTRPWNLRTMTTRRRTPKSIKYWTKTILCAILTKRSAVLCQVIMQLNVRIWAWLHDHLLFNNSQFACCDVRHCFSSCWWRSGPQDWLLYGDAGCSLLASRSEGNQICRSSGFGREAATHAIPVLYRPETRKTSSSTQSEEDVEHLNYNRALRNKLFRFHKEFSPLWKCDWRRLRDVFRRRERAGSARHYDVVELLGCKLQNYVCTLRPFCVNADREQGCLLYIWCLPRMCRW